MLRIVLVLVIEVFNEFHGFPGMELGIFRVAKSSGVSASGEGRRFVGMILIIFIVSCYEASQHTDMHPEGPFHHPPTRAPPVVSTRLLSSSVNHDTLTWWRPDVGL